MVRLLLGWLLSLLLLLLGGCLMVVSVSYSTGDNQRVTVTTAQGGES